jgi:hypothetical protein
LAAFVGTVGIGLLSEVFQIFISRDSSIRDFFLNTLGAFLFLAFGLLWKNEGFSKKRYKHQKTFQYIYVVSVAGISFFLFSPLVRLSIDEMKIKKSFPTIASFESEGELKRWYFGNNGAFLSRQFIDEGQYSLGVTFLQGEFAGISLNRLSSDWRGFDSFEFTVFNPSNTDFAIVLKIFDRDHDYNYDDRFNHYLHLSPGRNAVSIPLRKIESSPKTRKMRMDKIGQVSLFMRDLRQQKILYFDNIRLSKAVARR